MDFRDIWLIAFIVYLGLCLLIEAVYPVRVRKKYALKTEHAKWFWSYKHFFLYLWAWIVNASLFMLFWEFNEILRPIVLSLPFLMVYAAARIGRRNYRIFHGASPDDRAVGMPKIYSATLGKLSKPLRTTGHQTGLTLDHDLSTTALISSLIFFASTALFLLRLTDIDFEYAPPVPYNAIILGIGYIAGIVALVSYTNSYLVSTPTLLQVGRGPFRNPRDIPYRQLRSYRVVPQDPDATDPDTKDLSQWNLEFKVPRANKYTKELRDPNLEYLVRQIAFRVEQERWADDNSPADRERLEEYGRDARLVCITKGYIPVGKHAQEAADRASFKQTH